MRIARAAEAAGRDAAEVSLLAVSKTWAADSVREAAAAGQRAFGENYVQEGADKVDALAMVANPIFKNYFIIRYADLINTIYYPANVRKIAYQMRDSITMDMPQQFARWGGSDSSWAQNIAGLINFTNKRPQRALNHIESNFNLNGQVVLTLDAQPSGAGRIQISTIVPDSLPWKGTYFKGNPVSITAIPNPGYAFDHWGTNNSISATDSSQTIRINFTSSDSVVAYFTGSSIVPHITLVKLITNRPIQLMPAIGLNSIIPIRLT